MKKVWFILAVLMCILASCSDGGSETPVTPNQKPGTSASEITIDSTILSGGLAFEASQGEKSITFSASSDWSLSIAETRSGTVWCTASPTSGGKGTASVKFTTAENTEPDDRSVAVTIKAGTASKTFTITQKGKDALLVTSKKYEVPQEGGEIEIEVKANVDYQMEVSESAKEWITEASGRALTTHKHIMKVASSEEAVKREGEIIFKSGDIVETVKVYQAGGPILLLSKNEFIVSDAGETISVDVKSNIEYSVQMPNVDWIKEQEAGRAMSSHTLKYIITPNTETDSRSASIVFFDKNSSLSDSLIITQKSKLNIILSDKYLKTSPVGTVVWVKLNDKLGMCDVEVSPQDDWINLHSWSLYEAEISIDYNNRINESRIGKVIFRNLALQVTDTLTIEQAAPGGFLHSYLENQYGKYFLGVDSLKIDFPIGGVDNRWLRQMMGGSEFYKPDWGRLEKLDLSAATIVTRKDKSQYKESDGTLKNATFGTTENIISGYSNSNKLKCVYLPNNAEAISYQAFRNCDNLEKVIIGSGINSIGDYAFEGCSKLKNIKIPDNVVSLGKYAFQYCI